jgi:hypothetical protein
MPINNKSQDECKSILEVLNKYDFVMDEAASTLKVARELGENLKRFLHFVEHEAQETLIKANRVFDTAQETVKNTNELIKKAHHSWDSVTGTFNIASEIVFYGGVSALALFNLYNYLSNNDDSSNKIEYPGAQAIVLFVWLLAVSYKLHRYLNKTNTREDIKKSILPEKINKPISLEEELDKGISEIQKLQDDSSRIEGLRKIAKIISHPDFITKESILIKLIDVMSHKRRIDDIYENIAYIKPIMQKESVKEFLIEGLINITSNKDSLTYYKILTQALIIIGCLLELDSSLNFKFQQILTDASKGNDIVCKIISTKILVDRGLDTNTNLFDQLLQLLADKKNIYDAESKGIIKKLFSLDKSVLSVAQSRLSLGSKKVGSSFSQIMDILIDTNEIDDKIGDQIIHCLYMSSGQYTKHPDITS